PDTPPLERNPVFLYYSDGFQKPNPFTADIAVAIDDVVEKKIDAADALVSQVYEGGAMGSAETARSRHADDPVKRRAWLAERRRNGYARSADRFRETLIKWYGPEQGKAVKYAEAFGICEYGRRPSAEQIRQLFPFFPEP
ncbi:MAG: PIG-L family deacetylase, partial [Planctomycetota bacterium]